MESDDQKPIDPDQANLVDVLLLITLRVYASVGALVAAGLLMLGVIQFWHAFHIGFTDVKHSLFAPISHQSSAVSPALTTTNVHSVNTNEQAVMSGAAPAVTAGDAKEDTETWKKESAKQSLVFAIHGLEFVLLSPICFVVARSLFAYILVKYGRIAGISKAIVDKPELQDSGSNLIGSKALIMGLLSSLVGVDIVSRVLESKGTVDPSMWIMVALLAVLGAYYIALEHLAEAAGKHSGSK